MCPLNFTESFVENTVLAWLEARGYTILHGPDISTGKVCAERGDSNCGDVVPKTLISGALPAVNADQFLREAV